MGAVLSLVERLTRYVGRPLAFRVEAPLLLAVWSVSSLTQNLEAVADEEQGNPP